MKFIYINIFRHSDRTSILSTFNSSASEELMEQTKSDFIKVSRDFRKSSLYEGMRETNDEFVDNYRSNLQKQIGGCPIWYSTCDQNLLVYSVMAVGVKAQEAFQFLQDVNQLVLKQIPNLAREFDYIPSMEFKCGEAIQDLLNFDSDAVSESTSDCGK